MVINVRNRPSKRLEIYVKDIPPPGERRHVISVRYARIRRVQLAGTCMRARASQLLLRDTF